MKGRTSASERGHQPCTPGQTFPGVYQAVSALGAASATLVSLIPLCFQVGPTLVLPS